MTTLKVAVIGVGGIAHTHMPGWNSSPHAEVIAGCDISQENLAAWGEKYSIDTLTPDVTALFSNPDIDIIDICTPNNYHADLTIAALNAGKHVICEKPLAPTPSDVQRMIDARDASGKMLMTAQHFRSAGGAVIDIGVHILDLTLWMMGNPKPVTVSGVARTELAHLPGAFSTWRMADVDSAIYDVEEMAAAFVRFENGATLVLEVAWLLHHNTTGEDMQMWLYGKQGGSLWPKCEIYQTNNATKQIYNRQLTLTQDEMEPHALECVEFAKAIKNDAPSPVPAEQSLQVMTILDGIYKSQESGREVVVG